MYVIKIMIFVLGTGCIIWVSRASLRDVHNHGFYRFFSWETILVLFVLNVNYWFIDPISFNQTIRHPFYSSLLFLGWGILLKNVNLLTVILALVNAVLLVITAQKEEEENIVYFGEKYRTYMKYTKMFIPYIS